MLKALHGDAFVLKCQKGKNHGIVVIDGGPSKDSRKVVDVFDEYGTIDLMVLSHYDLDHIGGILAYVQKHKNDKPFPVREIWCNCAYEVPVVDSPNISYNHAKKLADLLEEINHNLKAAGCPEVIWQEEVMAGCKIERPYADFLILSPDAGVKQANDEQYVKTVANISRDYKRQKKALDIPLEELANNIKGQPSITDKSELVNWSSIAFYVACDNMKALMLGDSFPVSVENSLRAFGYDQENRLPVDYFKVSHHGSRNNISNELLDMVDSNVYLFSTNGGAGASCHPDRETIANILYHPGRNKGDAVRLCFNYPQNVILSNSYPFLKENEDKSAIFIDTYDEEYL